MKRSGTLLRFLTVVAMLVATAIAIAAHRRNPVLPPPTEKLASFPMTLGEWGGRDVPMATDVLEMLGRDGDYLTRMYTTRPPAASPWVDLYIAYFARAYSGEGIHSPRNCLPGSGWSFLESSYITMQTPGHAPWQVGRYVIANGPARDLVLYWYQSGSRRYASEYAGKFYGMTDAIRSKRTDAALVRIITPIASNETPQSAEARAMGFAQQMVPFLSRYVPD
jgi:EpsI family protein